MTDESIVEPSYDEIIIQLNTPPSPQLTSVDKKRLNKIVSCTICNKSMNEKTLKYFHDCQKTRTKKEKQASAITDEDIKVYLQRQQQEQQEHQQAIKQDKFNKLIRNMI